MYINEHGANCGTAVYSNATPPITRLLLVPRFFIGVNIVFVAEGRYGRFENHLIRYTLRGNNEAGLPPSLHMVVNLFDRADSSRLFGGGLLRSMHCQRSTKG